jgi:hypothetical protein
MREHDSQCWHFCKFCRKDYFHVLISNSTTLDTWLKPCPECIAEGITESQIKMEVQSRHVDEGRAEEGRLEQAEVSIAEGSASILPGAFREDEGVWTEQMGTERLPWAMARAAADVQSELRILQGAE